MKHRVLLVSPHFPPVNAPDHQRVRMALPYLAEFGWDATVLAVEPAKVEGALLDPLLEQSIPLGTQIFRADALPHRLTRRVGLGSLGLRALPSIWRAGGRLLEDDAFDLVFFSTTQFPVLILGPIWKRRFAVPYVIDFQDPWLGDYYERTNKQPPGGKIKHGFSQALARSLEPRVMREVSHVVSVSPSYVQTLRERYPHFPTDAFTILPFGAPEKDFALLPSLKIRQQVFDRRAGKIHLLYAGAAGRIMRISLRLLFTAVATLRRLDPTTWNQVSLHFAGTSYAPSGREEKTVESIAIECGIAELVEERPRRFPYFETLQALTEADALLVIGTDSPSYSASKIYPYILARKPMLSIFHAESPAAEIVRKCNAGELVTFDPADPAASAEAMSAALERLHDSAIRNSQSAFHSPVNQQEFQQYTAREMTRRLCEVFDRALGRDERAGTVSKLSV